MKNKILAILNEFTVAVHSFAGHTRNYVDESDFESIADKICEVDNWVSVEDRLPEENTEVMIYIEYSDYPIQAYRRKDNWYGSNEVRDCMGDGYVNDSKITGFNITHWQPLPSKHKNI